MAKDAKIIAPAMPNVTVFRLSHWEEDMLNFERAMMRDDPWGPSQDHVPDPVSSPCPVALCVGRGSFGSSSGGLPSQPPAPEVKQA